ncbi:hypothetical protein [Neobacillus terrae]|uniref:hypothetical protein n=1 Tax=Neobacillus terrae TaxID=3034837 RepID=UPI00140C2040|nr:hypothetical protein [Neobacillus terrae]
MVEVREWFYKHYQKRLKETTKSSREYMMKKHLLDNNFSQKPLSLITVQDIDLFYNLKLDENCSTNYIRKMHQMLYQAFSQAVKWKKIEHNPVSESDPPKVIKEEMNIWSINEIHTFLNSCKNERSYITFF